MRHATGIRADVRMKRETEREREIRDAPPTKTGRSETHQRRKYEPWKKEKERTQRGSHAHARLGLHMTRPSAASAVSFRPAAVLPPSLVAALLVGELSGLNSNRVVSPRRAVLRGCYSTRARKYATGSDVRVDGGACLCTPGPAIDRGKSDRRVDRSNFLRGDSGISLVRLSRSNEISLN